MILVRPDAATLARIRLAPSPAAEVVSWLRLTATGGRHPLHGDPGPTARFALRDPDVALVADAIGATGYVPDLLTPVPPVGTWLEAWNAQLEQIRHAPHVLAETHLPAHRAPGWRMPAQVRRAVDAGDFTRRAARGLRHFHDLVLGGQIEHLTAMVAADLAYRGQAFAMHGLGHVLRTLHPDLRWTGTELQLALPYDVSVALTGADLVLVPAILSRRRLGVQLDPTGHAYLCYPARGLDSTRDRGLHGLPQLIGPTRAAVLRDLDVPRTTTDLSRRHTLAKSTVSHHLGILLHAGLVVRARDGAVVRYGRTEQGDRMAAAS